MTVEYLLLMISIFLIVRELFPNTDNFKPKLKKILYSTLIGLLCILSVINIYNKNSENLELIKTAKSILKRTDEINTSLDSNFKSIEQAGSELDKIGGIVNSVNDTLKGQVRLIKEAVSKSEELVALERMKINLGRPRISILSGNVKLISFFQDSTKLQLDIEAQNRGNRTAKEVNYRYVLIVYKNGTRIRNVFLSDYFSKSIGSLEPNTKLGVKVPFNIKLSDFTNQYGRGILVGRIEYTDEIGDNNFDENYFIGIKKLPGKGMVFHTTNSKEKDYATKYLRELNLLDYLSK